MVQNKDKRPRSIKVGNGPLNWGVRKLPQRCFLDDLRSNEELTLKRLLCNSLRGRKYNLKSTADKIDVAKKPGFCESENG